MTVSRRTWQPRPEETGPGLKYDACRVCRGWTHRVSVEPELVTYRCEECGNVQTVDVDPPAEQQELDLSDQTYHPDGCTCGHHCLNCGWPLSGRQTKYCSDYCSQRYRAELALDAWLRSQPTAP